MTFAELKDQAKQLGISFSPNIGEEALTKRIAEHKDSYLQLAEPNPINQVFTVIDGVIPEKPSNVVSSLLDIRNKAIAQGTKLVRIRITCLDPKKKELKGEILTVCNEFIGTIRKFVPYGELTNDGYHVPYCIYEMLRDREFLSIQVVKDRRGHEHVNSKYVKEFAIEILPQLTQKELQDLSLAQQAAGSIEEGS